MPEDIVKSLKVKFCEGLPMGTRATFTYEKELWIAYPASKSARILGLIDRLLGIHAGIRDEMVRWINARPQDAELVTMVLHRVERARAVHEELIHEKTGARTA